MTCPSMYMIYSSFQRHGKWTTERRFLLQLQISTIETISCSPCLLDLWRSSLTMHLNRKLRPTPYRCHGWGWPLDFRNTSFSTAAILCAMWCSKNISFTLSYPLFPIVSLFSTWVASLTIFFARGVTPSFPTGCNKPVVPFTTISVVPPAAVPWEECFYNQQLQ